MRSSIPAHTDALCALAAVALCLALPAAATSVETAPAVLPVNFAIHPADTSVFYPTRLLHKGDRFEVKAHHLVDDSILVVVPCKPDCKRPDFMYAYSLQQGNQQLQIPMTGLYMFWVERDSYREEGLRTRGGLYRLPLKVHAYESADDHFTAMLDKGVEISLRTLYAHPIASATPASYTP